MSAFWRFGYSATSLDQLSDATDMNRPSLYAAFGDKRALYLQTLDSYTERSKEGIAKALDPELSLAEGLQRFYDSALAAYLPSGDPARGCYLIGTAVTEALGDEEVRTRLASALREFERMLEARIRKAREDGEIEATADPQVLAMIASAVLYTLAIRSRAGESRDDFALGRRDRDRSHLRTCTRAKATAAHIVGACGLQMRQDAHSGVQVSGRHDHDLVADAMEIEIDRRPGDRQAADRERFDADRQ